MTIEERLDAIEAKLRFIRIIEHQDPAYGTIYGWMFAGCRVGVNTSYWMQKDRGQGAGFSLGTDFDRFGVYVEMEGQQVCPDNPTVGLYVANLAQGPQPNHGIVTSAGGSPTSVGLVTSPNLLVAMDDGSGRGYLHRLEGIQVVGDISAVHIGKTMADAKKMWP